MTNEARAREMLAAELEAVRLEPGRCPESEDWVDLCKAAERAIESALSLRGEVTEALEASRLKYISCFDGDYADLLVIDENGAVGATGETVEEVHEHVLYGSAIAANRENAALLLAIIRSLAKQESGR